MKWRLFPLMLAACGLLTALACGGGGSDVTVRCITDNDCPDTQVCVAGDCVLPGDDGPRICNSKDDCYPGEDCIGGVCQPSQEEPPVDGGEDGGLDAGQDAGGDPGGEDAGLDAGEDAGEDGGGGTDEDLRDFSDLGFILVVGAAGNAAPQCIANVRPAANTGPSLPQTQALPGHTLSGRVTSGGGSVSGATVSILGEPSVCHAAPVTTDGTGNFSLQVPSGGPVDLRAVAPDGRAAQIRINYVGGNTSQDIALPATEDLMCSLLDQAGGWAVSAFYRESNPPRLAHAGVMTDPSGVATLPLEVGPAYDLFLMPPSASGFPYQLLLEDACHLDENCENDVFSELELANLDVRNGVTLSGSVEQQGVGPIQAASMRAVSTLDGRLTYSAQSGTGGAYQLLVRPAVFAFEIIPSGAAFAQGAMRYWDPGLGIYADGNLNFSIFTGQAVVFSGRLVDANGSPLANTPVSLILDESPQGSGSFGLCDPNTTSTAADGSFTVTCNLIPR